MMTVTGSSPRWVLALLAAAVFSSPMAARADKATADAAFVSADRCTDTEVNVFVKSGQVGKTTGSQNAKVTLTIAQVDVCEGRELLGAEAKNVNLKNGEFTVGDGTATLNAAIQVFDRRTGNKFMVDVFVEWVASGDPVTADVTTDVDDPGRFAKQARKFRKTLHLADASGTITDGATDFIAGLAEEASFTVAQ